MKILLITGDTTYLPTIRRALAKRLSAIDIAYTLEDYKTFLHSKKDAESEYDFILFDHDLCFSHNESEISILKISFPKSPLIVIYHDLNDEQKTSATQAGVKAFIHKKSLDTDLAKLLSKAP